MAGLKSLAESRSALFKINWRKLVARPGWNARDPNDPANRAHVEELALSMAQVGILEPLAVVVEGDDVVVKNGHCRLAAIPIAIEKHGAEIENVLCIPEPRGSNDADHKLSQLLRNAGKPLTPLEQGLVYKHLIGFGWPVTDIAKKAGKSVAHVNQSLQMQEAPEEARAMVASGQVSATLAAKVIRNAGPKAGVAKLKQAVDTARARGKIKATAKHVESEPVEQAIREAVSSAIETVGVDGLKETSLFGSNTPPPCLVVALRKIAKEQSFADPQTAVDTFQFIAREALIEAGIEPART